MKENINLCKAAGCNSPCCCRRLTIDLRGNEISAFVGAITLDEAKQTLAADPKANVAALVEPDYILDLPSGGFRAKLWVPNQCPQVTENGECGIYENRPKSCRDNKRGGALCNDSRNESGLSSVEAQFIE